MHRRRARRRSSSSALRAFASGSTAAPQQTGPHVGNTPRKPSPGKPGEPAPRTQSETLHRRHKTATLIVLSGAGLDTSAETIPYVAGWGETGALEAVTEHAELIDRLARTVENAISGDTANDAATADAVAA